MAITHIKGLDTLRAIAATVVMLGHIDLFTGRMGYDASFFFPNGHLGVVLFFSLSGFLITLLLLVEKQKNDDINLKFFYLRRIFRVWPLYFLIILISFLVSDFEPQWLTVLLCLTIFPNIAHTLRMGWAPSPQIWSIGVEEQFYIVLPLLVKKIKERYVPHIILGFFLFWSILPHGLLFLANRFYQDPDFMSLVNKFFFGAKYNCMAFGGLTAYIFWKHHNKLKSIFENKLILWISLLSPFLLWFFDFTLNYFMDEFYGVLFSIVIVAIASNQNLINSEFKLTRFLGKISYGIYMYHWIVLLILTEYKIVNFGSYWMDSIVLYSTTILATIGISYLSYRYFEKPFLKIKSRFNA